MSEVTTILAAIEQGERRAASHLYARGIFLACLHASRLLPSPWAGDWQCSCEGNAMGKRRVRLQIDTDELLIYAAKLVALQCGCSVSLAAEQALWQAWAEEIKEARRYYGESAEELGENAYRTPR